jgi:hypothetical protein
VTSLLGEYYVETLKCMTYLAGTPVDMNNVAEAESMYTTVLSRWEER